MRKLGSQVTKRVTVSLGDKEHTFLEKIYRETGVPMATYIRSLIREKLRATEIENR